MMLHQPRRLALAALACGVAAPALAGGFAQPVVTPVVTPPPVVVPTMMAPSGEWTGGFAGVQLSFADVSIDEFDGTETDLEGDGELFGLNAGYNRDFGRFVLGGEIQYDRGSVEVAEGTLLSLDVESVFRAGVRAGYDAGRFMPYVTGGYAGATADLEFGDDADLTGGYYGIGVDYKLRENIVLGAQILQHDFDEIDIDGVGEFDTEVDVRTIGLRATYNF